MACYIPPNRKQTTLKLVLQGVEKEVNLLRNQDGSAMETSDGYVYQASDGQCVTLRFAANDEDLPTPAQPTTPASAADSDNRHPLATLSEASAEDVELWSSRKTKFISKYSEMKDLVGRSRALRTRKLLWLKLAELLNEEFSCNLTATQVQNKWKSLDRSYKKSKKENSSSGHHRVSCEHEQELADILKKQHSVNPTLLLEPGATILSSGNSGGSTTDERPENLPAPKRKRNSRSKLPPLLVL
ncbi:uncharacterized protein [Dermacentor andersoni]|uniref:uncharacterized protein n=1 Tax=Dermacentor andersoni TaxID=34620 RepID=UPI0024162E91|nr:uncharacterized protein LOC126539369 [Dermacentor andersoni]